MALNQSFNIPDFLISENGHDNSDGFTILFLGLNELIYVKHLADLLIVENI